MLNFSNWNRVKIRALLFTFYTTSAIGTGSNPSSNILTKPNDFKNLADVVSGIHYDIRYAGNHNFVGRPIDGYMTAKCFVTKKTALALAHVQKELTPLGLALKIFDCYRPQRAVDDFVHWSNDINDQKHKAEYYPNERKNQLFQLGYIARQSGHSRGSTIDATLVATKKMPFPAGTIQGHLLPNGEVDMGSPFDLFDIRSHSDNPDLPNDAKHNRQWFRALMQRHGFDNYPKEWWHYTLRDEPYPNHYFNFPVQ